ncbi:hypothetical protein M2263_003233 [Providencia alcalifaciens]|nr:hypothetical protein [Providencia alcalifaciens]
MSTEPMYIDLKITDGDFTLDPGNEPILCQNRVSISQDIVHRIIENGLVKELIAERSPVLRRDILLRMELLTEEDVRLVPGTIVISEQGSGQYLVEADTYDFGRIEGVFQ